RWSTSRTGSLRRTGPSSSRSDPSCCPWISRPSFTCEATGRRSRTAAGSASSACARERPELNRPCAGGSLWPGHRRRARNAGAGGRRRPRPGDPGHPTRFLPRTPGRDRLLAAVGDADRVTHDTPIAHAGAAVVATVVSAGVDGAGFSEATPLAIEAASHFGFGELFEDAMGKGSLGTGVEAAES